MVYFWKIPEYEIADFEYKHDRTPSAEIIPTQTSTLKHVGIINVSEKPTYDKSLESFRIGVSRNCLST